PEMTRGKGVRLQKYKSALSAQGTLDLDGGLADITTFNWADGLSWPMGGDKTRHQADLTEWLGKRAGVGKRAPYGFPRNNKFS
ncbi:MAG: topoisomerase-4 subunit A, partial [Paracoccaceae bacterium]